MFTGIITNLGVIEKKSKTDLTIHTDRELLNKLTDGTSIAVDGICLTVVGKNKNTFRIDYMPETEKKTNIQYFKAGTEVNLELPATTETLFSGHIVQGHVDAIGKIKAITQEGNSYLFTFAIPKELNTYLVEKGSICINGISLTVISVNKTAFTVGIIPHTMKHTMLHNAEIGDMVNLEVDILAKYVKNMLNNK